MTCADFGVVQIRAGVEDIMYRAECQGCTRGWRSCTEVVGTWRKKRRKTAVGKTRRILRRFLYAKKVSCLPSAGRWLILFYHVGCGVSVLRQLSCVRCGGRGLYVCMNERGGFLMEAAPFAVRLCCQSFFMRAVAWYATSSDYSTMLMPRLLNVVLSMPMYVRIC